MFHSTLFFKGIYHSLLWIKSTETWSAMCVCVHIYIHITGPDFLSTNVFRISNQTTYFWEHNVFIPQRACNIIFHVCICTCVVTVYSHACLHLCIRACSCKGAFVPVNAKQMLVGWTSITGASPVSSPLNVGDSLSSCSAFSLLVDTQLHVETQRKVIRPGLEIWAPHTKLHFGVFTY